MLAEIKPPASTLQYCPHIRIRSTLAPSRTHFVQSRFGRDTIKPIEENTYQHLIMAQEQEARNQKFAEDLHFENKEVCGPTGTKRCACVCVCVCVCGCV